MHCGLRRFGYYGCDSDGREDGRQNAKGIAHCCPSVAVVGGNYKARNKPRLGIAEKGLGGRRSSMGQFAGRNGAFA